MISSSFFPKVDQSHPILRYSSRMKLQIFMMQLERIEIYLFDRISDKDLLLLEVKRR